MENKRPESFDETIARLKTDRDFRIRLTAFSHQWFFMTYFRDHVTYPLADLHREIFRMTQDPPTPLITVVAFRSSGKSTVLSLSYPIWAALSGRKKFILIVSKTESQVKQIMYNIKAELEGNQQLISDFGPFNTGDVWNELSLVLPQHAVRIVGVSAEHSLRGLKHRSHRPDLVIIDDVEDMESVRSGEVRDKRYRWLKSEVIPAGGESCQIWVVGNLLHEDSLVSRLRSEIENREIVGTYREYPIVVGGVPTWPGRFPSAAAVEELRMKIGDDRAFKREYLLQITPEADQVVDQSWLRYYDKLPDADGKRPGDGWELDFVATGVDPAISLRESADFTAMVSAAVYSRIRRDNLGNHFYTDHHIYILPVVTNAHLSVNGIIERAKVTAQICARPGHTHRFFVEDVAFQKALIDTMHGANLYVKGVKTDGMDKRSRLMIAARGMETGKVFFPRTGAEEVIRQIVGFGAERHDDLADAFSTLVRQADYTATHHPNIYVF